MSERRRAASERRGARRAPFVAAVRAVNGHVELALACNLGPDGMELRRAPDGAWPRDMPLALAFELPDGGELVEARAQVVFERAVGRYCAAGVRFESLSNADRERIVRFVDDQLD